MFMMKNTLSHNTLLIKKSIGLYTLCEGLQTNHMVSVKRLMYPPQGHFHDSCFGQGLRVNKLPLIH